MRNEGKAAELTATALLIFAALLVVVGSVVPSLRHFIEPCCACGLSPQDRLDYLIGSLVFGSLFAASFVLAIIILAKWGGAGEEARARA